MADESYEPKVYMKQEGDEQVVASGGVITVESGGAINVEAGGQIQDDGTQASAISDITVTGTYADDDDNIETAVNSILAALRGAGIIASS